MFTGHIRELGLVDRFDGERIQVRVPESAPAISRGSSVCVSGVRLTVQDLGDEVFGATVTAETRRRSTFDTLAPGDRVNVELPLTVGGALDGHLVQGYADAVGKVARVEDEGDCLRAWIRPPDRLMSQLVAKAPVAVDGVSVTIAERLHDRFSIVVLPVTRQATTLSRLRPSARVNLELDLVNRLVARRARAARADLMNVTAALAGAGHVSGRAALDKVLARIAAGGAVAVWDPDAENEGDVIFAGARLRPEAFRFLLTEVCGHPTVPCAPAVLDRLDIGPIPGPGDRQGTAFHIPVDLAAGTGTGVSAADRAAVVRRLANPSAVPADFLRPGHVYPLRARPGLLAERTGHTEATVALCTAAGLPPVGVCCEVMNRDGTMAAAADLEVAALRWGLPLVELPDLKAWL
jgi:3,4-dihydroxy 2-butanone 4-phosphate synthase/3,4-dihydroxy 2-butanone 4-phosphate synthase/GTP cyclohydrolase II